MCGAHTVTHMHMHTNAPLGWQVEEPPTKRPLAVKAHPPWRKAAEPSSLAAVDIYTWGKRAIQNDVPEQELDKIFQCDVVLDLTHIWVPNAAKGPLRHCSGFNATICLRLLMMPDFRGVISSLAG